MDETTRLHGDGDRRSLGDRYTLRGLLGKGGMADVELGYDEQLDREVAVKILHARYADDPSFVARFRREAQAAASLNHPNIVGIYDTGQSNGRPYIVMEYVRGRSLRDVIREEAVSPERALEITGDAALGLHYAHERGLVHRDIKPGNILLSHDGQVKVTDFGIARAVDAETVTQTAAVFGTAAYIAPEQAQGEQVDRRTDVYSLGCVLYELLTGRQPFTADSPVALAYKHISEHPPPPSRINPDVADELDAVVLKAMAKDPADRYQTAREFNADLQRVDAGMPIAAPPPAAYEATQVIDRDATTVVDRPPEEYYEYEEADERRGRRGVGYALLALLVVGAFALAAVLLSGVFDQQAEAQVPDVVGLNINEAQQLLEARGFQPRLGDPEENAEFAANEVIRTEPEAGRLAPEGSVVTIIYSSGAPMVAIPQLRGETVEAAEQALRDAGFSLGQQRERPHAEIEEGLVINTQPPAGRRVAEGSTVSLIVSTGPQPVAVPSLEGLTQEEAQAALEEAGLALGDVTEEASNEIDEGLVIRSEPPEGEEVAAESTVNLVVSSGPGLIPVPNVRGQTPAEAAAAIVDAGLDVGETLMERSNDVNEGLVIRTDPPAGEELEEGTAVDLIVSSGPELVAVPDVEGLPEDEAREELEEACDDPTPCFEVEVEEEFSDDVEEGNVIETDPEADEEIEPGSEVTMIVSQGPEDENGGGN